MRALVVDDDEGQRGLVRRILEREGFHVDEAEDGGKALQCLRHLEPELIVLDLEMPHLDGRGFLDVRRETGVAARALVIVVSGALLEELPEGCLCLPKPMERTAFLALVARVTSL